jgi:hypothetical protein
VVAVALFIIAGIAVELVFLPQGSSPTVSGTTTVSTTTMTSTPSYCQGGGPSCVPPSSNLSAAVDHWVTAFDARDVTGLVNFYANDALVDWTSSPDVVPNALDGVYNGIGCQFGLFFRAKVLIGKGNQESTVGV